MTLENLRIVANTATFNGGGIYSEDAYQVKIINSEISENTAGAAGGGIADSRSGLDDAPGLQIINSTISMNTVTHPSGKGGGLYAWRDDDGSLITLPIINSTIAANQAAMGGGIYSQTVTGPSFVEIHNSIVAENVNLSNVANDIKGLNLAAGTYNLIGSGGSGGLIHNVANNKVLGSLGAARLDDLDFYGGSTRSHALKYDSPAAEAGGDAIDDLWNIDFDQRGFDRTANNDSAFGDGIDIGAFELAVDEYFS